MHTIDLTVPCVRWPGALDRYGYGRRKIEGKTVMAHRHAYESEVGPIPLGLTIDHLCFNRSCINTAHMSVVTRAENARRHNPNCGCPVHQRVRQQLCCRGHLLAIIGRDAKGQCRRCARERNRDYMRRRRAA